MKGAARSGESARARNAALALAALLALIALVAIVSAGVAPGIGREKPSASAPQFLADYVGTIALLMVPIGAFIFVFAMTQRRVAIAQRRVAKRSPVGMLFVMGALLLALGLRAAHPGWFSRHSNPAANRTAPFTKSGTGKGGRSAPPAQAEAHVKWPLIFVFGSVVLASVGTAAVLGLRRRRGLLEPPSTAAAVAKVLDESLDDLRGEPDSRKAVIRTYARMERTFAAHGFAREPFEAPVEYLVRTLEVVRASAESVRRLTQLFQRARFSTHGVDEGMKSEAIDSLVALRVELEAAAQ